MEERRCWLGSLRPAHGQRGLDSHSRWQGIDRHRPQHPKKWVKITPNKIHERFKNLNIFDTVPLAAIRHQIRGVMLDAVAPAIFVESEKLTD